MRLLILGDTAGTGFGTVTGNLGREFLALGADVRFVSLNERMTPVLVEEPFVGRTAEIGRGWLQMPDAPEPPGGGATPEEEEHFRRATEAWAVYRQKIEGWALGNLFPDGWPPEAAIIIGDVGSLKLSPFPNFIPDGFPVFHYVPVEGVGLPPLWREVWKVIRPIAMSEFGADQIAAVGLARPPVVYHGVDTATFFPVSARAIDVYAGRGARSEELGRAARVLALKEGRRFGVTEGILSSKADCKQFIGLPRESTVIYRADRHVIRKNYASLFRSLAPVLAKHPEAILLYHCRSLDQGGDLDDERSKYGPLRGWEPCNSPDRCIRGGVHPVFGGVASRMVSTGLHDHFGGADPAMLNILYNAADVYASVSAEGFGLTIAEAMACDVPAVGMDYSSVSEVIGDAGILVPPRGLVDNIYSHFWAIVDEDKFGEAVGSLVRSRKARRDLSGKGPERIRRMFTWADAAGAMLRIVQAREGIAA